MDHVGLEAVRSGLDRTTWTNYRANGVPDLELDTLCISFRIHPGSLYEGWFEAGLEYPDTE